MDEKLLKIDEVMARVGIGRSTIFLWVRDGSFPAPIYLSPRQTRWTNSSINEWIEERIRISREGGVERCITPNGPSGKYATQKEAGGLSN